MKLREEQATVKFQFEYEVVCGGCQAKITLLIPAVDGILIEPFQNSEVSVFGRELLGNWGWFDSKNRPDYREQTAVVYADNFSDLKIEIDNAIVSATNSLGIVVNTYNSKMEKMPEPCEIDKTFSYKVIDADD